MKLRNASTKHGVHIMVKVKTNFNDYLLLFKYSFQYSIGLRLEKDLCTWNILNFEEKLPSG